MKKVLKIYLAVILLTGFTSRGQNISVTVGTVSSPVTNVQLDVPFTVSGLNGQYAVTALEFYIDFDSTVVNYVQVKNFYSGTPSHEWYFSIPPVNRFACNWVQSQLLPISIPNNTKLFDIVFFLKKPSSTVLNLDEVFSVLVNASYQQIPNSIINFVDGAVNFTGYIPPTGLTEFNPINILSFPDSTFNVSVKLTDFSNNNSSLAALTLNFQFNQSNIIFQQIQNINPLLPANQWSFTQSSPGTLTATWIHPNQQNVIIPDGTIIFDLVFKGNNPGQSQLTFNPSACTFTHYHNGVPYNMFSNFNSCGIQIVQVPNPPPGMVYFDPDLYVSYPDSIITVPIKISGFHTSSSAIFGMGFKLNFNSAFLEFQNVSNFSALLPQNEWIITPGQNSITFSWTNAQSNNVVIPNQTKLFEIKFKTTAVGNTAITLGPPSYFYHQFYQYVLQFQANFNTASVQIYDNTMPLPGYVRIEPNYFLTRPDSLVSLPILMSGFGLQNSGLAKIKLYLNFNDQILNFVSPQNFSSLLPSSQWLIQYNSAQHRMECFWEEPNGQNVLIPDNTKIFELTFQATNTGTSVFSFDSLLCTYTHELLGNYYNILANHGGATVQVNPLPPPTPGYVSIIPANYNTYPDSTITVPVVFSGFNLPDNSPSSIHLHLYFDNTKLQYQSVTNFSPYLPVNQWAIAYQPMESKLILHWNEPNSQNFPIPDNTTAFQIIFKAINLGNSSLTFDPTSSYFIHKLNNTNQYGTINFSNGSVTITELPLPPPGSVSMNPDQFTVYQGNSFNVPVWMSGFGMPNSGLIQIQLAVALNPNILQFNQVFGFNPLVPQNQWQINFNQASGVLTMIWNSPSGQNVLIPDQTKLFEIALTGNNPGISSIEFQPQSCVLIHKQFAGQVALQANYSSATATVLPQVNPENPKIKLIPAFIQEVSGLTVNVNVVLFGFNTDSTSVTAIEFYIDFNNQVAQFTGVSNFSPLMPQNQWFHSVPGPALNRFACNWAEPSLLNLKVPDSTTIMTLHFLLLSGETPLTFDEANSLFVHIDSQFNLIELEVSYYNGYIVVLPSQIQEKPVTTENEKWFTISNRNIILDGIQGTARIFNLAGQLIYQGEIRSDHHKISLHQQGIYILSLTTPEGKILHTKIFIQ